MFPTKQGALLGVSFFHSVQSTLYLTPDIREGNIELVSSRTVLYTSVTLHHCQHERIQKVLSEGVQIWYLFFFVDEGIDDPNITIYGPSPARQQNAI